MVSVPSITGLLLLVILLLVLRRCIQRKTGESDPAAVYSSVHRTSDINYAQIPIKMNCRQRDLPSEPAVIYSSLKPSHTPSPQCNQSE
ncbi:unnamed protein product [Oreochromis niloticus]|nr:unnamed protein product [Mustela putorius furo]